MFSWRRGDAGWMQSWARARSAADGGISGRRESWVGQTMRTETSDSNYNISTAAQSSGKNERNDDAGLKRVWWARAR